LKLNSFNGSFVNNNEVIIRTPGHYNIGKFLPFTHLVYNKRTELFIYNIKNKYEYPIFYNKIISFEDPRVFNVTNNIGILSYIKYNKETKNSKLIAVVINKKPFKIITKEIELKYSKKKHKNWILINGKKLNDTHWSCYFYPSHIIIRVNMFNGNIRFGWKTKSPLSVKNLRGGTNMVEVNNKLLAIGHIKKIFPYYIYSQFYKIENKPPYNIIYGSKMFTILNEKCEYPMSLYYKNKKIETLYGINDNKIIQATFNIEQFLNL
jgi:hypothetical protein